MKSIKYLFFWISLFLISCNFSDKSDSQKEESYFVESRYLDGNPASISKQFKDTIINGKSFNYKFKKQFDSIGNILRIGYFINDKAIGFHQFFENGKLVSIREYKIFSEDQIQFLQGVDLSKAQSLTVDSTFLNETFFFNANKEIIIDKSSFYKIDLLKSTIFIGDSIKAIIRFFEPKIKIKFVQVYFDIPNDKNNIRLIQNSKNEIKYSYLPMKKGKGKISGFAFISGVLHENNNNKYFRASRMMFIEKNYEVK
ncbi:MAG: hypothetical protein HXX09_10155 [Bacteroidetes bacterium]|nr:hypothetical protein [Bacteroidota bacterium]